MSVVRTDRHEVVARDSILGVQNHHCSAPPVVAHIIHLLLTGSEPLRWQGHEQVEEVSLGVLVRLGHPGRS